MNILSISTDRAILQEGHAAQVKAQWLARAGTHTHLVLFTIDRTLPKAIVVSDQLTVYPTRSRHPLLYVADGRRIAQRIAEEQAIDVVTTQDPFLTGLVGTWIKKRYALPLQVQVHTDISASEFSAHSYTNRIRMLMSMHVLAHADRARVVSKRVAVYLHDRYPYLDTVVLPVWVNTPHINLSQALDLGSQYKANTVVVTASRLEHEKNIDQIIDAFAGVSTEDQVLIIIGSGSQEEALRNQAQTSNAGERIHFVSWTQQLPSYLKGSDIYVSASAYEGFGLSLVEAALSGCRIVSTPVGVVGHELSSDVYQVSTSNDLGKALKQALENETSPQLQKEAQLLCMEKEEYLERYRDALVIQ